MIELTKYFPVPELDLAWRLKDELTFIQTDTGTRIHATGLAQVIGKCDSLSEKDRNITLSAAKTLGDFMKQGPVIVRPSLALCNALLDTELNFHVTDYRQPFPIVGVEIPTEISGLKAPVLVISALVKPTWMVAWFRNWETLATYHIQVGPRKPTIEDEVAKLEWTDTDEEAKFLHRVWRVSINTVLLAANRQTRTEPLPENVIKKRRRPDERIRQLAARPCQEIVFRDLVIYDRTQDKQEGDPSGMVHGKQHRRGHWRKVAHGPRFSLHRLRWINDYWTHQEDEGEKPAIVMR